MFKKDYIQVIQPLKFCHPLSPHPGSPAELSHPLVEIPAFGAPERLCRQSSYVCLSPERHLSSPYHLRLPTLSFATSLILPHNGIHPTFTALTPPPTPPLLSFLSAPPQAPRPRPTDRSGEPDKLIQGSLSDLKKTNKQTTFIPLQLVVDM